jgi:hypothetical protein
MKRVAFVLFVFLAGCSGAGPLTDTTEEAPPVVLVDEALGLEAIRDIREAQSAFMATRRRYAQFMSELFDTRMITANPSWGDSGYTVRIRPTPAADGYGATVTAPPDAPVRSFYVDDTGVIRWASGEAATADSPEIEDETPSDQ